jgi:branched-chain amino acid transport system substrate-binding protein
MKKRRSLPLIAGAATLLMLGTSAPAVAGDASGSDIVIAVEAPLSGSQAGNGKDIARGVRLAVEQANAAGGVLGRHVRLVQLDDAANPALADDMVQQAQAAGAVAVVGPYNSSVGVVNLPQFLDASIVPVHLVSTNDVDGMGVTVQPKNNQISPVETAYAESVGATTIAMLVDPSTYTQGMANRFAKAMTANGATVTSIPIVEGQADYTAEVAQALTGVPDLVYVSTYYPEGSKIAQALVRSKLPTKCFMGLANVDSAFVSAAGLPASQRCAFSGLPEAAQFPGKPAHAYVADYKEAFGKTPGVWGIFSYDSTRLLFAAMERTGSTDFGALLHALDLTKGFAGATGPITIDPKTGNRPNVPVFILRVDDRGVFRVAQ